GVQAARAGLDGRLQQALDGARERLLDFGAELEARLDHPGEDLGELSDTALIESLDAFAADVRRLAGTWTHTRRRIEGAVVALVGSVNAGKSSLFNHLVGARRALVSDQPGTTRDAVERTVDWDGLQVTFVDTAGRRAASGEIEAAGIALGQALAESADLRLHVFDPRRPSNAFSLPEPTWQVATHADCEARPSAAHHHVSNITEAGLADLRAALSEWLGAVDPAGSALVGSQRQHDLLLRVVDHVERAGEAMVVGVGPVVAAEEVVYALERLGSLAGQNVREDVLDRLFSRFCVGK
ncbi:MAG TPA: tRNA uridine-5-carboxymethylaminomethyl(34) synthesis GTPase MnmE, partial [Deltaproteobacteria bacterium]|nr:tRNA uridine-5-carboxymethylaminomethyl(34) synthesis GTPase MnmE [Deltaproteobacteria bacterium]